MIDVQSFSKEVRVGSSLQCMLGRDCDIWNISVSDVGWKADDADGGGKGKYS